MGLLFWIAGIVIAGVGALLLLSARTFSREAAARMIQKTVDRRIGKHDVTGAIVLVDSPKHGVNQAFTAGNIADETQPFHVASVGKTFTAALIGTLIDEGALRLDDRIADYLDDALLNGLYVFQGRDYYGDVTVRQLLSHTSGVADYFEDKPSGAMPMRDLMLEDRDKLWTPQELVAFTRTYQRAVSKPGVTFHYSDTGYILLGLLIETISGMTFDRMLHERIFTPLHMDDSYLLFYSKPKNPVRPMADVWLSGVNIKDFRALSIDWAGGGIVSTVRDLAVFARALHAGTIIREETLRAFCRFDQTYMSGIRYGCGLMEYRFGEFFFTLRSLPRYVGHMGVLGTQMFYYKPTDSVYIGSFGSDSAPGDSVRTMIKVLRILAKTKRGT